VLTLALGWAGPAFAGPTTDPTTAAGYGAGWLARQFTAQGFIAGSGGSADLSDTVGAAQALAAANVGGTQFDAAVAYLKAHVDGDVKDSKGADLPGRLGDLIILAVAHGDDPKAFGGQDLVARLKATKQTTGTDAGFFGASAAGAAAFDGTLRQSLALLGLVAAKVTPDADSIAWLKNQQCPDGGWQAYRADTTKACDATDLANFAGEDSNSTAFAVEALAALNTTPANDALAFLKSLQTTDGGFGVFKGSTTDANSTGLALQAIAARGESATAGRWVAGSSNPITAILALQLGCASPEADRGSFAFQPAIADATSRLLATIEAVPGVAGKPFPLAKTSPSTSVPVVACAVATTTTTAVPAAATTSVTTVGGVRSSTVSGSSAAASGATLPATGPAGTRDLVRNALALVLIGVALVTAGRKTSPAWRHSSRRMT
jgi:hypothetical protein